MSLPFKDGPEARAWLASNRNESALASNRFGLTSDAREFVEQLYATGVSRVFVPRPSVSTRVTKHHPSYLFTRIGSFFFGGTET